MVFCCLSSSKSCYLNIKVKNATDISRLSGICRVAFILDEGDSTVKLYCVTFWIFEAQLKGIGIILFPKICHGYTLPPIFPSTDVPHNDQVFNKINTKKMIL
jgi:hypothetical protein